MTHDTRYTCTCCVFVSNVVWVRVNHRFSGLSFGYEIWIWNLDMKFGSYPNFISKFHIQISYSKLKNENRWFSRTQTTLDTKTQHVQLYLVSWVTFMTTLGTLIDEIRLPLCYVWSSPITNKNHSKISRIQFLTWFCLLLVKITHNIAIGGG